MWECDEMFYNRETQSKIDRGLLHVCRHCDGLITYGVYIHDELYCPDCAREYAADMDETELLDAVDYDREMEIPDIYAYIQNMDIEELADYMGWDIWED